MAKPKVRFDLIDMGERPLLMSRPVREKVAVKATATVGKVKSTKKPKRYEKTKAKAARVLPVRVNLAGNQSLRVVADAGNFRKTLGEAAASSPTLSSATKSMSEADVAEIMSNYAAYVKSGRGRRVGAFKGEINELGLVSHDEMPAALQRARAKAAAAPGWRGDVFVVKGARIRGNRRLGADFLIVIVDNPKGPQKIWILAVIESKSASNALHVVSYGARGEIPAIGLVFKEGENTGQSEWSVERMKYFGLDLTEARIVGGTGDGRPILREYDGDNVRAYWSRRVSPADQLTEHIGVIPRDLETANEYFVTNRADKKGIQIWRHRETNKMTTDVATKALDLLDGLIR